VGSTPVTGSLKVTVKLTVLALVVGLYELPFPTQALAIVLTL
jgi:hypothetical protein